MKKYKRNGFTLIELILTSVLVALAGLASYHAFGQGILIWKKGQEQSNQDKAVMAVERISRDFKNTFGFAPIDFNGEETAVSFPYLSVKYDWNQLSAGEEKETQFDDSSSVDPLPLIAKLRYEYDRDSGKLWRAEEIYAYPDMEELKIVPDGTKKEISRIILEEVEVMKFSYAITKTPELSFSPNAINDGMPYAIRIELKLKSMKDSLFRTVFIPVNKSFDN